jgi:hypothetical protein
MDGFEGSDLIYWLFPSAVAKTCNSTKRKRQHDNIDESNIIEGQV